MSGRPRASIGGAIHREPRNFPGGVEVRGREYALDCLIYATGFEVGTDYSRRAGMEILGAGGSLALR